LKPILILFYECINCDVYIPEEGKSKSAALGTRRKNTAGVQIQTYERNSRLSWGGGATASLLSRQHWPKSLAVKQKRNKWREESVAAEEVEAAGAGRQLSSHTHRGERRSAAPPRRAAPCHQRQKKKKKNIKNR